MRRKALATAAVLVVAALVAAASSPWALAWAVVHDLLRPAARPLAPLLGWKTEASYLSVSTPAGPARALLVRPRGPDPAAGIVLVHGMIATGEEDWRLRRLAETLAAAGFTALAPAVSGLKRGAVVEEDIAVVATSLEHLRAKVEGVDPARVGVFGISVGSGPALAAAARSPERTAFAGAFGGYYDLVEVLKGLAKAGRDLEGQLVSTDRWDFFRANSHLAPDEEDRALLLELARLPRVEREAQAGAVSGRLSPAGRALAELLTTERPERVEVLVEAAGPEVNRLRRALSPRYFAHRLTMRLFLAHGLPDPVIPHTETLRLAQAVPEGSEPAVALLPLFGHADPRSFESGLVERLKALRDMHRLIWDLIKQRR
jgi:pimeloyl-ACP methyl ester carboxylesterase